MSVVKVTDENYGQLIAQPGLVLVMYDVCRSNYRNERRLRSAFRGLARQHAGKLHVGLVDFDKCSAERSTTNFIPTFRIFQEGKVAGCLSFTTSSESLIGWVEEFLSEDDGMEGVRVENRDGGLTT